MPVQAAMIGNRSGLIAIAPTISTELLLMTANAPTTPAAAISSRYRPGARARALAWPSTSAQTSANGPASSGTSAIRSSRVSTMSSDVTPRRSRVASTASAASALTSAVTIAVAEPAPAMLRCLTPCRPASPSETAAIAAGSPYARSSNTLAR